MIAAESAQQYRAVVDCVIPFSSCDAWLQANSCYLGVSLGTRPFERPMLDATVRWLAENFKRCAVLVGDGIHRLTLQITQGLSEQEAFVEACRLGDLFLAQNKDLFNEYTGCEFEFIRCYSIQQTPEYSRHEHTLTTLFESDEEFAASIRTSAICFINRRRRDKNDTLADREKMVSLSCRYLIEEMAIFACLVKQGWEIEVYPGEELPTLSEIANGAYTDVPPELKFRVNIALKLRKLRRGI